MNPTGSARRAGAVGLALVDEVVAVLNAEDQPLRPGEVGEIAVQGPNVMAGYLNDPEATALALRRGWLHTGDMGYFDPDGFLFLTDRKKDLIIHGGENISPWEVEEVLQTHPAVAEVAVVGAADREWGEEIVAFLIPKTNQDLVADELRDFCRARLARFKVPRRMEVVSGLPLTSVGKVDKARLRALAASE